MTGRHRKLDRVHIYDAYPYSEAIGDYVEPSLQPRHREEGEEYRLRDAPGSVRELRDLLVMHEHEYPGAEVYFVGDLPQPWAEGPVFAWPFTFRIDDEGDLIIRVGDPDVHLYPKERAA